MMNCPRNLTELAGLVCQRHHCPCDTIGHAAMLCLLRAVDRTVVIRCTPISPFQEAGWMRGAYAVPETNSEKM